MMPTPPLTACPWCSTPLQGGVCYTCQVQWQPVSSFELPPLSPGAVPRAPPYRPPARTPSRPSPESKAKRAYRRFIRYLPPVRLVWIFLALLIYLQGILSSPSGVEVFLGVVLLSAGLDLAIQYGRFVKLRIPDAALAIGTFLVILIQPQVLDITVVAVTVCTIVIRHALRYNGHPWFNPTAMGLTVGYFLFGLAYPWSVAKVSLVDPASVTSYFSLNEIIMILLGVTLILRQRNSWRYVVYFFVAVIPMYVLSPLLVGYPIPTLTGASFLTNVLSPMVLFFGFFMVTEPRTSPASPKHVWMFSVMVAGLLVFLSLLFSLPQETEIAPLGAITPFLALFGGNLFTLTLRLAKRAKRAKPVRRAATRSVPTWDQRRYGSGAMPTFPGWPQPAPGGWAAEYPPWPGAYP